MFNVIERWQKSEVPTISAQISADVTGGNVELVPATQADMRGGVFETRASLEVVYDEA